MSGGRHVHNLQVYRDLMLELGGVTEEGAPLEPHLAEEWLAGSGVQPASAAQVLELVELLQGRWKRFFEELVMQVVAVAGYPSAQNVFFRRDYNIAISKNPGMSKREMTNLWLTLRSRHRRRSFSPREAYWRAKLLDGIGWRRLKNGEYIAPSPGPDPRKTYGLTPGMTRDEIRARVGLEPLPDTEGGSEVVTW